MRQDIRNTISTIVSGITPYDDLETNHIADTLSWIDSGDPIFRITKPDVPNKHLVSYFILFDENASKILLVDHKNAQLWLPSGGHMEENEHPQETVTRECLEELSIPADFWSTQPLFLTSTVTTGLMAGHTDVSLWYVLKGNHKSDYCFDKTEFNGIRWFDFDDIPYPRTDPHMHRFLKKLQGVL
jgi:8-oxo-dGTP diphosphatase